MRKAINDLKDPPCPPRLAAQVEAIVAAAEAQFLKDFTAWEEKHG
jgi:hypothetical protein